MMTKSHHFNNFIEELTAALNLHNVVMLSPQNTLSCLPFIKMQTIYRVINLSVIRQREDTIGFFDRSCFNHDASPGRSENLSVPSQRALSGAAELVTVRTFPTAPVGRDQGWKVRFINYHSVICCLFEVHSHMTSIFVSTKRCHETVLCISNVVFLSAVSPLRVPFLTREKTADRLFFSARRTIETFFKKSVCRVQTQ